MTALKQPLFLFYYVGNSEMKASILEFIKKLVSSTHWILIHKKI